MAITPSETDLDPKTPSSDYRAMVHYWSMVGAILHGVDAMRAREGYGNMANVAGPAVPYAHLAMLNRGLLRTTSGQGSPYLPQFPNETDADYELRRLNAPMANIYSDISRNLASKPFSKTLELAPDTADDLKELANNIDGQGNNLHVFARETFKSGLDKAVDWILVDHTKVAPGSTLAAERQAGARPYWVRICAENLVAVYSTCFNGKEIFTHARIYESSTEQVGYGEQTVERVRVFDRAPIIDINNNVVGYAPATWQLFQLVVNEADQTAKKGANWVQVDGGNVTIGIIPLIPFMTGRRNGSSWRIDPPLKDLAYMQVEEFQQESNLKTIKELTAFPMVAGQGVTPPTGQDGKDTFVPVGPRSVLYAPPAANGQSGAWQFIEPSAQSLVFLQSDLDKLRAEMREIGMQPLATANLTVVTTANISMKAHSAVQAWALGLKDALEQAWLITCLWLNRSDKPVVNVHTDFGVDMEAGTELDALLRAEAQGILSKRTTWDEFKRRGVLSDDFDPDEEEKRLATEQQGLEPEVAIDPVTGELVQPSTRPLRMNPPNPSQQQQQLAPKPNQQAA